MKDVQTVESLRRFQSDLSFERPTGTPLRALDFKPPSVPEVMESMIDWQADRLDSESANPSH